VQPQTLRPDLAQPSRSPQKTLVIEAVEQITLVVRKPGSDLAQNM
jgi:hypothetical protein